MGRKVNLLFVFAGVSLMLWAGYQYLHPYWKKPDLPDLPEYTQLKTEGMPRGVKEQIAAAYNKAHENQYNSANNGRLGMVLHAYSRYELAAICYERAQRLKPEELAWTYFLGLTQAKRGFIDTAIRNMKRALIINEKYWPARLKLAELFLNTGDLENSRKHYETVLRIVPDYPYVQYGYGKLLMQAGNITDAIKHFKIAINVSENASSKFAAAHYSLALAYQKSGKISDAARHMDIYKKNPGLHPISNDPLLVEVEKYNLGSIQRLEMAEKFLMQGNFDEAIEIYNEILDIEPENLGALGNLITAYGNKGLIKTANKYYQKALTVNTKWSQAHYAYGRILLRYDRYDEAIDVFEKAIASNPSFTDAHLELGITHEKAGNLHKAKKLYRDALKLEPNNQKVNALFGRLLSNKGKKEEAIIYLKRASAHNNKHTPVMLAEIGNIYLSLGEHDKGIQSLKEAHAAAVKTGQHQLAGQLIKSLQRFKNNINQ